jgi:hypothetical protein
VIGLSVGWIFAENVFTRFLPLWIGVLQAVEFDWSFLFLSLESNASLLVIMIVIALVDMWSGRRKRGMWLEEGSAFVLNVFFSN